MTAAPLQKKTSLCSLKNAAAQAVIVHLPVAPQVVYRTRFSPPPPSCNHYLLVPEALEHLEQMMEKNDGAVSMVAISGPGDPLATPEITCRTAELIHRAFPDLPIALQTLGIGSRQLAGDLAQSGITSVEMQVDGVKADILEKIYAWIRPGSKTLKLKEAVALLIQEQRNGVSALKFNAINVSILTTLYPGYNIDHAVNISAAMMELGADGISLIPYLAAANAEVALEPPSPDEVALATAKAAVYLPIVEPIPRNTAGATADQTAGREPLQLQPSKERPNVAVVSSNGIDIDLHLGQAIRFLVYGPSHDDLACLLESRDAPEPGSGPSRWDKTAAILKDCFVILAASAGEAPRKTLGGHGLKVYVIEDNIEGIINVLYGGGKKKGKSAGKK